MVDLICMGLHVIAVMIANREFLNKKKCPQLDSNTGPSAYEANALSVEVFEMINIDHHKMTRFKPWFAINSYLYCVVDIVKYSVV